MFPMTGDCTEMKEMVESDVRNSQTNREDRNLHGKKKCPEHIEASLPEDMIERILSLLPATCMFKLRSVCKKWNITLSSPQFLKTCIHQSLGRPMLFTFTDDRKRDAAGYSISKEWYKFPFSFVPHLTDVKASSGGLLLCTNLVGRDDGFVDNGYIVCNPATKGWIQLPQPSWPEECLSDVKLVYQSSSQRFQVIRTVFNVGHVQNSTLCTLEVFDSQSGTWTLGGRITHCKPSSMVMCNDTVYCLHTTWPHKLLTSRLGTCMCQSFDLPLAMEFPKLVEWHGNVLLTGLTQQLSKLQIWMLDPVTFQWTTTGKCIDSRAMGSGEAITHVAAVTCGDLIIFYGELEARYNTDLLAFDISCQKWKFVPSCLMADVRMSGPCYWSCDLSLDTPF